MCGANYSAFRVASSNLTVPLYPTTGHFARSVPRRQPTRMPPRSLASLAHALGASSDLDGALIALGDCLAELDRGASLALLKYDARKEMLRERLMPINGQVLHGRLETTFDHLPEPHRAKVAAGGQFVELNDKSADYARLFGFVSSMEGGLLSLRGIRVEGFLSALLALYEPRKIFGTRTTERLAPALALFDLAFGRLPRKRRVKRRCGHSRTSHNACTVSTCVG